MIPSGLECVHNYRCPTNIQYPIDLTILMNLESIEELF